MYFVLKLLGTKNNCLYSNKIFETYAKKAHGIFHTRQVNTLWPQRHRTRVQENENVPGQRHNMQEMFKTLPGAFREV